MIYICGFISSGKTTHGKAVAKAANYDFVDVSDLVKQITGEHKREKLQGRPDLDVEIIDRLKKMNDSTVVAGARQTTILNAFPNAAYIWLEVDEEERFRRLSGRIDNKDPDKTREAFNIAQERDNQLGTAEVRDFIINHPSGQVKNN